MEKNPELAGEGQLKSYLYTSVKNNCLMRLRNEGVRKRFRAGVERKNKNRLNIAALEQIDTSDAAFRELERIVETTLASLPPRCREIFVLSRFEGKKNKEIARKLNISGKAVEAQITKAIKIFKVALSYYLPMLALSAITQLFFK